MMKTVFVSIVLNEEGLIGRNLKQHYDYCDRWIIVEGADKRYPKNLVSEDGLSIDETAAAIREFPDPDGKIEFIQRGLVSSKSDLRNVYADRIETDCRVVVFDADEFVCRSHFEMIFALIGAIGRAGVVRIPHVHFWKHDRQVVEGSYYNVPHDRCYGWLAGSRYGDDHNHPMYNGVMLRDIRIKTVHRNWTVTDRGVTHPLPFFAHYGFCKPAWTIEAKNNYYIARGEKHSRPATTRARSAFFQPTLPEGISVRPWVGDIPEVFHEDRPSWLGGGNWQRPDEPRPV